MDISTPLMTKFEFTQMQALEAQGIPHEEAKAKVYAERGPSGEPRSGPVAFAPTPSTPPNVVPISNGRTSLSLPWWAVLGLIGLVIYYFKRTPATSGTATSSPIGDLNDLPTGMMSKPKKRKRNK